MPSASRVLQDHTILQCRSLDRLYLNAYIPELQRPELVKRFLERVATPIASPALFRQRSEHFVADLRAYAEAHGAPWISFERGERKEDRMRPLLEGAASRLLPGLVAVGVAQERTTGWRGTKRPLERGGFTFGFSRTSVYVNQYYCYLWDADWGPTFIKLSGYAPWGGRVWLNGHEWAKRQLERRGVAFEALDNGFRSVADPGVLDAVTSTLGPDQVRAFFARWMRELPQPLTAEDRDAGYGYALSMLQVEVSDTRVFDRPIRARQWFEATIPEQLTLGRPETVSLLFRRRPNRRTSWRFETRVVNAYTSPTITFRYKHSTVKQYLKEGLALRTETTVNDSYDFDTGRRLEHLPQIRARGEAINAGLLEHEANAETARLHGPELTDLVRPTISDDRRIAALRFGDPRVMALLAAVVMFAHLPAGFSNAQLRRHVAALLSIPLGEYTSARMTYDLGRLAGHGLIERIPHSQRYRPTAAGLRQAVFLTKLADRVLDSGLSRTGLPVPTGPPWQAFDRSLRVLLRRTHIAPS
jgi:hypothetical protein